MHMDETLYCGILSDSAKFREWFERYCAAHEVHEDDRWHNRDRLAGTWNAALDAAFGIKRTRDEAYALGRRLDDERRI
jgi:hypothetical protein